MKSYHKTERPSTRRTGSKIFVLPTPSCKAPRSLRRFAFCFPDLYEIGMSSQATQILYDVLNKDESIWCERFFAPWFDMREQMENENAELFSLESRTPLSEFDVIGFTLQYEMSYTNVLYMLELGKVKLFSRERGENDPFVVGVAPAPATRSPWPSSSTCSPWATARRPTTRSATA